MIITASDFDFAKYQAGEYGDHCIIHGDCRDVIGKIPDKAIDIFVTSPPYNTLPTSNKPSGLHAERKSGVNKWIQKASSGYFDSMPEDEYQSWIAGIIGDCLRCALGVVWVNHKIRYRDGAAVHPVRFLPFPIYSEVVWDRRGSMALNCKRYAPSHESIWGFGHPHFWDDSLNTLMSVWQLDFDRGNDNHPCAFPIKIVERVITSSCPSNGIILDPFLGSGTTLVAAKNLGRKAIGIEINYDYCSIAENRLRQEVLAL